MDEDNKKPVIEVHKKLVTKLKPHQVEGTSIDIRAISYMFL